jgi:hypothetical protein
MSIRQNIYGVNNVEDFKNIFGTKNDELTLMLLKNCEETLKLEEGSEEYEEGIMAVKNAVDFGGETLENSDFDHYYIIFDLLINQNGTIYTDSDYWWNCNTYFSNLLEKVDGKPKELISFFMDGRKIFSEGNTDSEFPYCYLTLDEMKFILNDMNNNPDKYKDPENFDKDFKMCMEEFVANGKDLFFMQS